MKIAARPQDIGPAWMTDALTQGGLLKGQKVVDLSFAGVGHGMMSDSFRFHLTYDRDADVLPPTIVGKFAAADPTSKATATAYMIYRTEVGFYRDVAPTLAANVPTTLFADLDERTDDFTVLMRDLSPARTVDQMEGCSLEDAETALREAAKLHGSRWNDPTLGELPWLARRAEINERVLAVLPELFSGFLDRYQEMLEPEYRRHVAELVPVYPRIIRDRSAPLTLQHGDYRLDNLLYDVGGEPGVHILDWGTVAHATGLTDISYFIGASLDAGQRAAHEQELVRVYFDALNGFPIGTYSWEDCWRDYRRFCFLGLFTGVAAPMMVERSDRADKLFLGMVRNYCEQIETLGGFSYWR